MHSLKTSYISAIGLFAGIIYLSLGANGAQISYDLIRGQKIKSIANLPTENLKKHTNILHEAECLRLCKDELCTGLAYSQSTKECYVNQYGRILLEPDPGSTAWIKSMLIWTFWNKCSAIFRIILNEYSEIIGSRNIIPANECLILEIDNYLLY